MTKLIVALDFDTLDEVDNLLDQLSDTVQWYKLGKQLFTAHGPKLIDHIKGKGKSLFLDLKFHDIPNTVAQAVRVSVASGVDMINVHASGGSEMIAAAAQAAQAENPDALMIAVTVLTSMDEQALEEIGLNVSPAEQVIRLAKLAQAAGASGIVASAKESALITENCGADFIQVLPGIRPSGADQQDQKRVVTPAEAAALGAHYIVVGRPISKAENPAQAAQEILKDIAPA
ncbi:MAG: orotidine-5'-phosphate decarboxylase [Lentisphaeria bacterium]|nr:orotidine-5'-phosphate decarboxylase [Lentisphaeria bacterium]NQZ66833.1 orotidine-5'-phosphate decarboxylase [Lentisphaeria bacterium]